MEGGIPLKWRQIIRREIYKENSDFFEYFYIKDTQFEL